MTRVLAALSGGIDSSVAAALLLEQGYEVIGCIGIMHGSALETPDVQAARDVAKSLDIPFHVVDLRASFSEHVIAPFCSHYCCGLTPSPCIECNKYVKFGALQNTMHVLKCDFLATGHYARIIEHNNLFELHKALDERKDQSYMLARLSQEQLAHTLFPLGALNKTEVRERARVLNLANANRPESQDICFVPDGDYAAFIERTFPKARVSDDVFFLADASQDDNTQHSAKMQISNDLQHRDLCKAFFPGDFVNTNGDTLGKHRGIIHYTVGQRKGIGLAFGDPRYVCRINPDSYTITLGTAADLLTHDVYSSDFTWISGQAPAMPLSCTAKVRYRQSEKPVSVALCEIAFTPQRADALVVSNSNQRPRQDESNELLAADASASATYTHLYFEDALKAIAPGQYAVLYDGTCVLGAGSIARAPQ